MMRHTIITAPTTLIALFLSTTLFGQAATSELEAARAEMQAGRDLIIKEDLRLDADELAGFWPIYQAYVADMSVLRDRKAVLITRFMEAYQGGNFSDEFAAWLIEENFAVKNEWIRVQKAYVERFSAVLSTQAIARFYQLENKMDAEVDAQLALVVPLVE